MTIKTKRFKLSKEQEKKLDKYFLYVGEKCRISYIYACCLIQNVNYIYYNKKVVPPNKIHKWFLTDFLVNYSNEDNQVDLYYMNIASIFLKNKNNFDLYANETDVLSRINQRELYFKNKEVPFQNLEAYCEYVANRGMKSDVYQDEIYNFVVRDK